MDLKEIFFVTKIRASISVGYVTLANFTSYLGYYFLVKVEKNVPTVDRPAFHEVNRVPT